MIPVGQENVTLGVVLRQTQWALDDAAHHLPAGRYTPDRCAELAAILEDVAGLLRDRASSGSVVDERPR